MGSAFNGDSLAKVTGKSQMEHQSSHISRFVGCIAHDHSHRLSLLQSPRAHQIKVPKFVGDSGVTLDRELSGLHQSSPCSRGHPPLSDLLCQRKLDQTEWKLNIEVFHSIYKRFGKTFLLGQQSLDPQGDFCLFCF